MKIDKINWRTSFLSVMKMKSIFLYTAFCWPHSCWRWFKLGSPSKLGPAMHIIVGFAVAVILFEGGMNLRISRIRREQTVIRVLITIGALISMIGGTLATKFILNWDWRSAILFGTLIIVTGPTVISPLVRRIRMDHGVSTVLEAEGILLDAIGTIVAIVTWRLPSVPRVFPF